MSSDIESWPPPDDASAFESLCLDFWKEIWNDPNAQKNGRSGQPQAGVDVFGLCEGNQVGVQCKQKDNLLRSKLTVAELQQEAEKAKNFRPALSTFIVATTGPRDVRVQEHARLLTEKNKREGLFSVEVWSWQDIWHEIYRHEDLMNRIGPIYWPRLHKSARRRIPPKAGLLRLFLLLVISIVVYLIVEKLPRGRTGLPASALERYVGVLTNTGPTTNQLVVTIGSTGGRFQLTGTNSFDLLGASYLPELHSSDILRENKISARIDNGRLYVSARILDRESRQIVEILDNEWSSATKPLVWDKNYTNNALEVKDSLGDVVIQLSLRGNQLSFQARLFGSDGRSIAFIEPSPQAFYQIILDPPKTLKIQPLFKYPSGLHIGELSSDVPRSASMPNLRLLVAGRELVEFESGRALSLVLVLPDGTTKIPIGLTNSSPTTLTNVEVILIATGDFATWENTDTSSLTKGAAITSFCAIPFIEPFETIPLRLILKSEPQFEERDKQILLPAIATVISTERECTRAGFNVIFQRGIVTPYILMFPNVLAGTQFGLPDDFYLKPQKYGVLKK